MATGAFKHLKLITFERPSLVFTAGESIKGNLVFNDADRPFKVFDLHLLLTGVVRQSRHYRPYIEHKRHLEDYMYKILTVYASSRITKPDDCVILPPRAKLEVPFEMELPESLWSTFIGGLGYTVYRLIVVGRPNSPVFGKGGLLCHKEIVIIGLVSPIKDGFLEPYSTTKVFTSKSGETAKLSVSLDRTYATPGETFSFSAVIENGLKLPLASVKMVFQQNVYYDFKGNPKLFAHQQKDQEVNILVQKEGPSIPPGPGRRVPWNYSFQVPHCVPTEMGSEGCKLIKLNYCISFVSAKFVNLRVMVPIHIGTVSKEVDWEEYSLAYGKELKRSLSTQSLAAWANDVGSCWSLLDVGGDSDSRAGSSSSSRTGPPSYDSEWEFTPIETPPPMYRDSTNVDEEERR